MCGRWNVDLHTVKSNVQNIQIINTLAIIVPGFIFYKFMCFECLFKLTVLQLF